MGDGFVEAVEFFEDVAADEDGLVAEEEVEMAGAEGGEFAGEFEEEGGRVEEAGEGAADEVAGGVERGGDLGEGVRREAGVGVEEEEDVGGGLGGAEVLLFGAGCDGGCDDVAAGIYGDGDGGVGGVGVHDDYFRLEVAGIHGFQGGLEVIGLVSCRNNDRDGGGHGVMGYTLRIRGATAKAKALLTCGAAILEFGQI